MPLAVTVAAPRHWQVTGTGTGRTATVKGVVAGKRERLVRVSATITRRGKATLAAIDSLPVNQLPSGAGGAHSDVARTMLIMMIEVKRPRARHGCTRS